MNRAEEIYDMATVAAAQVVNLHLDRPKHEQFDAVLKVVHAALRLAVMEERAQLLKPSKN